MQRDRWSPIKLQIHKAKQKNRSIAKLPDIEWPWKCGLRLRRACIRRCPPSQVSSQGIQY